MFFIAGFQEDSEPSKVVEIIQCAPEGSDNKEDIIVNYDHVLPKEQEVEWKSTEIQLDLGSTDIFVTNLESTITTIEYPRKYSLSLVLICKRILVLFAIIDT